MAVPLADTAALSMDEQLRALIPGDVPCPVDCIMLGWMDGGRSLAACRSYCPAIGMWHDMLISTLAQREPPDCNCDSELLKCN